MGLHQFPHTNSMQKTPQMHLNTSVTCFEGPRGWKVVLGIRGRKIGFRCCLMTVFLLGAFFENAFFPKGWPTNPHKWVCLAGKISVSLPRPFCSILDPPNANIRQNQKKWSRINTKEQVPYIYIYICIYFSLILRGAAGLEQTRRWKLLPKRQISTT